MLNCRNTIIAVMLFSFFTATTMTAAESGSLNYVMLFDLSYKGELLQKGVYKVDWEVAGEDAKVTFNPAGKTDSVTITGKVEPTPNKYETDNIVYRKNSSGERIISQFEIGGENFRIVFK